MFFFLAENKAKRAVPVFFFFLLAYVLSRSGLYIKLNQNFYISTDYTRNILTFCVFSEYFITYFKGNNKFRAHNNSCLLYTSPSPRDKRQSRMPSSA